MNTKEMVSGYSKFRHNSGAVKLSRRRKIFKQGEWDKFMALINDREFNLPYLCDAPRIVYDKHRGTFRGIVEVSDNKDFSDSYEIERECPKYALTHLTSGILPLGDISRYIKTAQYLDMYEEGKLQFDENFDLFSLRYNHLKNINQTLKSSFTVFRQENSRTSRTIAVDVDDYFGKMIRAFVTEKYKITHDRDFFPMAFDRLGSFESLQFARGEITPLRSTATFAVSEGQIVLNRPVLAGASIVNSEFKDSSVYIKASIVIGNEDKDDEGNIVFDGFTRNYTRKITHRGRGFEGRIKRGIDYVGKIAESLEEYVVKQLNRADALIIDIEDVTENNDPVIQDFISIKSKKKYGDIMQLKDEKGYADNVAGIFLTLVDYATNVEKSDSTRSQIQHKAEKILSDPDAFKARFGREPSRGDNIMFQL